MMISKGYFWDKKGLLFGPDVPNFSHASHPAIVHVRDNLHLIAFSARDSKQRSHIFLCYAEVADSKIELVGEPQLALGLGDPGHFDSEGLLCCCFVKYHSKCYLYYCGWQNLPEGLWFCDTGRAIVNVDKLTAEREYLGPVLGRDKNNPLFAVATAVHVTSKGLWRTWYNSGIKWEKKNDEWLPRYGIHYGHSKNGIDWVCEPGLIIPFRDEYEHSFGRPSVAYWDEQFCMWFAHRGTKDYSTYRIGFAKSDDGLKWKRNDKMSGIGISRDGWDSESVCYPYVFEHKGTRYMLYNGNNYGETGFGYAVMADTVK